MVAKSKFTYKVYEDRGCGPMALGDHHCERQRLERGGTVAPLRHVRRR